MYETLAGIAARRHGHRAINETHAAAHRSRRAVRAARRSHRPASGHLLDACCGPRRRTGRQDDLEHRFDALTAAHGDACRRAARRSPSRSTGRAPIRPLASATDRPCRSDRRRAAGARAGMPTPLSVTVSLTVPSSRRAPRRTVPPGGVCRSALAARFCTACSRRMRIADHPDVIVMRLDRRSSTPLSCAVLA